jgi:ferric-dicitrate binding protein FerR (iron transport regulator)
VKTLAIRLEEEQHAQLGMIAQLEELTVTDAIRQAIEQWIEARRTNPQLQARAEAVLADIDRDAATRRDAIASLLGGPTPAKRRGGNGGPKGAQAALGREGSLVPGYL